MADFERRSGGAGWLCLGVLSISTLRQKELSEVIDDEMWNSMFKPVDILQQGLAASWTRNTVIRNNIANVETPGFKASEVEFESLMSQALSGTGFQGVRTHARHIEIGSGNPANVRPRIIKNESTSMRMDGNNVDIEAENVKLAQNSIYYNTLLEKMNSEIRRLRTAISEGR